MRDTLLNLATIIALKQTQEATRPSPQLQPLTPNLSMAASITPFPPMNPPPTMLLLIISQTTEPSAVILKISPAPPVPSMTPQDIQQMVKSIVDRSENERGRVFTYN